MLLVHPVIELGRFVPALLGLFLASGGSIRGLRAGAIAGGVVILLGVMRWVTTRFRITPEQIQLRRGLLRRSTVAAPMDRVRTVDVTAHLLHRVLGLAKVEIGTGISERKGRDRLVLDGLGADAAGRLRAELLHRGQQHSAVDAESSAASVDQQIVRLNPAWVRYAPFTLSGAITGLALAGFAWRIGNEAHLDPSRVGPLRAIGDQLRRTSIALDVGAITIAVLVFVAIASTAGYVLAFWNFRLTRHSGGTLHVTRGLITSRATSIERRRLLGAEISEALLLRSVGAARCLAIATGLRGGPSAERGNGLLLPPAPRAEAIRVAADVLETAAPFTGALVAHGAAARTRRLVRALIAAFALIFCVGGAAAEAGAHKAVLGLPAQAAVSGLAVMALVYAVGHLSGAHINPAVTIAFTVTRHFPPREAASYIAAQLTGAATAGLVLLAAWPDKPGHLGANVASVATGTALLYETLLAALLMFVILAVATDTRAAGASMNPARSFGPALASGTWTHFWIYVVGPVAGATGGALAYQFIRTPRVAAPS